MQEALAWPRDGPARRPASGRERPRSARSRRARAAPACAGAPAIGAQHPGIELERRREIGALQPAGDPLIGGAEPPGLRLGGRPQPLQQAGARRDSRRGRTAPARPARPRGFSAGRRGSGRPRAAASPGRAPPGPAPRCDRCSARRSAPATGTPACFSARTISSWTMPRRPSRIRISPGPYRRPVLARISPRSSQRRMVRGDGPGDPPLGLVARPRVVRQRPRLVLRVGGGRPCHAATARPAPARWRARWHAAARLRPRPRRACASGSANTASTSGQHGRDRAERAIQQLGADRRLPRPRPGWSARSGPAGNWRGRHPGNYRSTASRRRPRTASAGAACAPSPAKNSSVSLHDDLPLLRAGVLRLVDQHVLDPRIQLEQHPLAAAGPLRAAAGRARSGRRSRAPPRAPSALVGVDRRRRRRAAVPRCAAPSSRPRSWSPSRTSRACSCLERLQDRLGGHLLGRQRLAARRRRP